MPAGLSSTDGRIRPNTCDIGARPPLWTRNRNKSLFGDTLSTWPAWWWSDFCRNQEQRLGIVCIRCTKLVFWAPRTSTRMVDTLRDMESPDGFIHTLHSISVLSQFNKKKPRKNLNKWIHLLWCCRSKLATFWKN